MAALATVPREKKARAAEPEPEPIIIPPIAMRVPVDAVDVGHNVRADVGDLSELVESLEQHGLLQPIGIRDSAVDGRFDLVYGQRRLLAARQAGWSHIAAIAVVFGGDRGVLQLVENLQRRDLGPIEEAKAFQQLLAGDKDLTQAELAKRIGRSAPYVSNALRILELDKKVLPLVASGQLSGSHAKALASLKGPAQRELAKQAVEYPLSAHDLEIRVTQYHASQKREAEEVKELGQWAETAEAVLLEKGADKKTTTLTSTDGYGYRDDPVHKAMKARGWKLGSLSASYSRGKCDCDAFGVSKNWDGGVHAVRRCIVRAHYEAKNLAEGRTRTTSWEEQNRVRKAYEARQQLVKKGMRDQVAAGVRKMPPAVARVLLWVAMDWSLNEWVKQHKGDRKKPDAWGSLSELEGTALVDALTTFSLKAFTDRYNVKLDWPAIAVTFGVQLPPEKPAKNARAKS